jgi:hypothetical protein
LSLLLIPAAQVRALARALGPGLTRLCLGGCHLGPDFWPALEELLPSLKVLHLKPAVSMTAPDLLTFCNKTTQRPISIQCEVQPVGLDSPDGSQQAVGAGAGAVVLQYVNGGGTIAVQARAAEVQAEGQAEEGAVQVPSRHVLVPIVQPPAPPPPGLTDEERWGIRGYGLLCGEPDLINA